MATRLFLVGVISLFFGIQFRVVETFVLNEKTSAIVNKRIAKRPTIVKKEPLVAGLYDPYYEVQPKVPAILLPSKHRISPPRWLGYSLISVGAVLVLTFPALR